MVGFLESGLKYNWDLGKEASINYGLLKNIKACDKKRVGIYTNSLHSFNISFK